MRSYLLFTRGLILLLLVFTAIELSALPSTGSDKIPLGIEDAFKLAIAASQDYYEARQNTILAISKEKSIWNLFNPDISASYNAKLDYNKSPFLIKPDSATSQNNRVVEQNPFSNSFSFNLGFSISNTFMLDIAKLKTDRLGFEIEEEKTKAVILRDTEKTYFQLVFSQLDIENKKQSVALAEEKTKLAKARFEAGLNPELDVLRALMTEQSSKNNYEKAVAEYNKKLLAFKTTLGLSVNSEVSFITPIDIPLKLLDFDISYYIDNKPDLKKDELNVLITTNNLKNNFYSNRLPVLSAGTSWKLNSSGSGIEDIITAQDSFSANLKLTFTIDSWIYGTKKEKEYRELKDKAEKAQIKYNKNKELAIIEINEMFKDIEFQKKNLDLLESQLALAERIYKQTELAFANGTATSLELQSGLLDLDSSKQSLLNGYYNYLNKLIDMAYALNTNWRSLVL